MSRIEPLPLDEIEPDLARAIKQSHASGVLSSTEPLQVWAHRPDTASHWLAALDSFYKDSLLDERLRELVRLKIASVTQCDTCQLARKSDTVSDDDIACMSIEHSAFAEDVKAALHFAELFASDHAAIGDAEFSALRAHFSEAAVIELNLFCGLMLAGGKVTFVLRDQDGVQ